MASSPAPPSIPRIGIALVLALLALAVLAAPPAVAQDGDQARIARLVVADALAHTLTVLDPVTDERLATFGTPGRIGNVVRSSNGRWVFAVHTDANRLTILDIGLRRVDHGDHLDLVVGMPYVRATVFPGRKPIDFWAGHGMATVHNDDDGTLRVLDDERLEESVVLARINGAGTGHNNAVVLEETVLLSLASEGQVTAYNLVDGRAGQTFDGCPGTHGWTTPSRALAAAGCTDGVMLFTKSGAQITARKIGEPVGSPEAARVSTLVSHPASPVLVGNFGQGLAIVRPDAVEAQPVPLATAPVRFAFNQAGTRIVVLTLDGKLQALDPESGEALWSIDAVTPVDTATAGAPRPSLAVGNEVAYLTDPPTGRIVKADLGTGRLFGTPLAIGGTPTAVALVELDGAEH